MKKSLRSIDDCEHVDRDVLASLLAPGVMWGVVLVLSLAAIIAGAAAALSQIGGAQEPVGPAQPFVSGVHLINLTFWLGIACSGIFISAVLCLFRTRCHRAFSRIAEFIALSAAATAALIWLLHFCQPSVVPFFANGRLLNESFKDPIDLNALSFGMYLTVSILFVLMGLLPDLASLRDCSQGARRIAYALLALGWQGRLQQWRHYVAAYRFLAVAAALLALFMSSAVSWVLVVQNVPGRYSADEPLGLVLAALLSGLAMTTAVTVILRKALRMEEYLAVEHFEGMARLLLATALLSGFIVMMFPVGFGGSVHAAFHSRPVVLRGRSLLFWLMIAGGVIALFSLCLKRLRTNLLWLFVLSAVLSVIVWLGCRNTLAASHVSDFGPALRSALGPLSIDFMVTMGYLGWFSMCLLVLVRVFPVVSIVRVKEEIARRAARGGGSVCGTAGPDWLCNRSAV